MVLSFRSIATILGLFFMLLFQGCMKEWLDAKPDSSIATPTLPVDFRGMLDNGDFLVYGTPYFNELASDQDTLTDDLWQGIIETPFGNAINWNENIPYQENFDWTSSYKAIFHVNVALEGISKLKEDATSNQLKGEALYHRGLLHYYVAAEFARPYDPANISDEYGIPLRNVSDLNVPVVRSTVGETYISILNDVRMAASFLPEQSDVVTRPSKKSAWGLLSRVFLSMQQYDSAQKYADMYIARFPALLDFNTLDPGMSFIDINVEVGSLHFYQPGAVYSFGVPKSLYERYEENDLRSVIYFQVIDGIANFKGSYSRGDMDCFTGVATDEMYLNSAECLARKGDIPKAMQRLNTLLRTRYKVIEGVNSYVDKSAENAEQALGIILEEREKELVRRGTRWSDLRRLNKDPRFAKTIKKTLGGITYTLVPNSDRYTFPIPRDVVAKTGVKQNPGW